MSNTVLNDYFRLSRRLFIQHKTYTLYKITQAVKDFAVWGIPRVNVLYSMSHFCSPVKELQAVKSLSFQLHVLTSTTLVLSFLDRLYERLSFPNK